MSATDWMTVAEAAEYARVSAQTVRKWLRDGLLAGRNLGGKTGYRIHARNLDAFLADGQPAAA